MIRVEPATEEHARAIAPRLVIFGCDLGALDVAPEVMAVRHVRNSLEAWTWLDAETPLAMAGVFPRSLIGNAGVPWLLTTPEAFRDRRAFWRASKAVVAYLRHQYAAIDGQVDAGFDASQRWLTRLGFRIVDTPYDFEGRRVLPFVMEP